MRERRKVRARGPVGPRGLALCIGVGLAIGLSGCAGDDETPQVAGAATAAGGGAGTMTAASRKSAQEQAPAYADCLRRNGVILMQEPDGPPEPDKVKTPIEVVDTAQRLCAAERPPEDLAEAPDAGDLSRAREFAACIREHGVEDWPDPESDGSRPHAAEDAGLKQNPKLPAALKACEYVNQGAGNQGNAGG